MTHSRFRKSALALAALAGLALAAAPAFAEQAKKPAAPAAAQYKTEAEAKGHCAAGDLVVWVNTSTKVYHYAGTADYGKTKKGGYACEKEAGASGFHAAKNEKRPG
jgi:hypothetical protein